jgi:hypothetical protein
VFSVVLMMFPVFCEGCLVGEYISRVHLRLDGTYAETRFRPSTKLTIPSDSVGATVQSTAGSRGMRVSW